MLTPVPSTSQVRWPCHKPGGVGQGLARLDEAPEQCLEDGQGEPGPGLAVGRGGEGERREARQVGTGGVAVQDLEDEQVDGRDRVEDPVAPAAAQGPAEVPQGERFKPVGQVVTDLPQGGGE